MKIVYFLFIGLILSLTLAVDFDSAFLKGEIKTSAIQEFFSSQFLTLVEKMLPCIQVKYLEEKIEKPLLKLEVTLENLKFTKISLPKENYNIQFYHGKSGLDVARQRCEKESGLECELQENSYYPKCKKNFKGEDTTCKPTCPSEFSDWGASCAKPKPYGRGVGYPWKFGDGMSLEKAKQRCLKDWPELGCQKVGEIYYPNCRAGFHNVACCICSPNCPEGFKDIGEFCDKPSKYTRKQYQDVDENVMITTANHFDASLETLITIKIDGITNVKKGQLKIETKDSNFYGRLGMGLEKGSLQFHFENTDIELNNFNIDLHGSFSAEVFNLIISIVENLIRKKVQELLDTLGQAIEPQLNQALVNMPKKFPIGKSGMAIEYNLIEAPETYSDLVKFYLNGTISFNPIEQLTAFEQKESSFFVDKDDDILITINKNGINEILNNAFKANLLKISQNLNYSTFGITVKQSNITCVEYAPNILIDPTMISINVSAEMNTTMQQGEDAQFLDYNMVIYLVPQLDIKIQDDGFKIVIINITLVDLKGPMPEQMHMPREFFIMMLKGVIESAIPEVNAKLPVIQIPQFGGVTMKANKLKLLQDAIEFQTKFIYSEELVKTLMDLISKALEAPEIQQVVPLENICKKNSLFDYQ